MRPMKVGVFSESSRNKGLGRNRFNGDTDITAKDRGRKGQNKVGKYTGDVHRHIVKHVR
jgi:hypothetical protein